jgi:predicted PurR-regulated permease PerM
LGSVTGLNPVWVFVSILAGVRIGGLLGVIIAVPTAAVLKTILFVLRSPQSTSIAALLKSGTPGDEGLAIVPAETPAPEAQA